MAPFERVKIMFQVTNEKYSLKKFPRILHHIYNTEGIHALWKGHSAAILRVFPYSGIQFATFDAMKRFVSGKFPSDNGQHLPLHLTMFSGGTAAFVSTIMTYPLDLTRARLAVIPAGNDS